MIGLLMLLSDVSAAAQPPTPIGSPGEWISSEDYPAEALSTRDIGIVGFTLSISPAGAVQGCTIQRTSGSKILDDTTCTLLTGRAKFTPATDSAGRHVSGSYSNRVRWQLPEQTEQAVAEVESDGQGFPFGDAFFQAIDGPELGRQSDEDLGDVLIYLVPRFIDKLAVGCATFRSPKGEAFALPPAQIEGYRRESEAAESGLSN